MLSGPPEPRELACKDTKFYVGKGNLLLYCEHRLKMYYFSFISCCIVAIPVRSGGGGRGQSILITVYSLCIYENLIKTILFHQYNRCQQLKGGFLVSCSKTIGGNNYLVAERFYSVLQFNQSNQQLRYYDCLYARWVQIGKPVARM